MGSIPTQGTLKTQDNFVSEFFLYNYIIMKNKIIVIGIIIIGLIIISFFGYVIFNFKPGSYINAQEYIINEKEELVIEAIEDFKKENPQYIVPEYLGLNDGRDENLVNDHWYHLYFYNNKSNQIIYAWVRSNLENTNTTFALVAVNEGLTLGNWKDVNKELNEFENKKVKEMFVNQILNPIKKQIRAKR